MHKILALAVLLGLAASAYAGTITGVVQAKAPEPPDTPSAGGAGGYSSRTLQLAEKVDYSRMTDFVVYINQVVPESVPSPQVYKAITTQKDANFDPHVLPVAVGTIVQWPNKDEIFHNVYSTSDAKSFDLRYYKNTDQTKDPIPEIPFDKVGRVDVFCAIHSRMHCIILVVPSKYFAKADSRGRYEITGIPPGTYKLRAWQERMPAKDVEVVVPAEGEVKVNFTLSISDLLKN